jgi:ubiquinone/menaquinone biosynthesis C-methylase UbiE
MDGASAVYDATAEAYAENVGTELNDRCETAFDLGILGAAIAAFRTVPGTVLDLGCGPGRATAFLHRAGLDVVGVDPSAGMLAVARRTHPDLRFEHGSINAIPVPDGSAAGIVCWYSIIHTAPDNLDAAFTEMQRACRPGASLVLAFQSGAGERLDRPNAYGSEHVLTLYRHGLDDVQQRLRATGFVIHAYAQREAELEFETTPQAFVIARTQEPS